MTYLLITLAAYIALWLYRPKLLICRPIRFVVGWLFVMTIGTPPQFDAEGRSVRLGPVEAAKYAWWVTGRYPK